MGRMKSVLGVLLALLLLVAGAGIAAGAVPPKAVIDLSHGQTVDLIGFKSVLTTMGWQFDETTSLAAGVPNDCDLLVLPQPLSEFTDAEVAAVRAWVETQGGGLLVLYDSGAPTPYLNKLPAAFGVTFNAGVVQEYDFGISWWVDSAMISIPAELQSHPLFTNVTDFVYVSGTSLNVSGSPQVVLRAGEYTQCTSGVYQYGVEQPPVLVADQVTAGRVVLLGDTTPFELSLDSLTSGNVQLMANIVSWLQKPEAPPVPTTKKVTINIRPWSKDNKIDLQSKGFIRVAVLSTPEFDAKQVDPKTVLFAGAKPLCWVRMDVDRDRDKDLLLLFHIPDLNLTEDSTEAVLDGKTLDGQSFEGRDAVQVVQHKKCKNPPKHDNCGGKKGK